MKASGETHGDKTWNTQTNTLDPIEQQWRQQLFGATQGAAAAGPGAGATGAMDYYKQLMGAGATGTAALAGDQAATSTLMNPYIQQVIDANNADWAHTNAATTGIINDQATQARAFGGNRAAVAQGVALSNNNRAQGTQTAGLLSGGFDSAMQRAAMLASGGAGGAGAAAGLSMQGVDNPALWKMLQLRGGMLGVPYGTSTGTTNTTEGYSSGFRLGA